MWILPKNNLIKCILTQDEDCHVASQMQGYSTRDVWLLTVGFGLRVLVDFGSGTLADQDVGAPWAGGTGRSRNPGPASVCLQSGVLHKQTIYLSELWLPHLWNHYYFHNSTYLPELL